MKVILSIEKLNKKNKKKTMFHTYLNRKYIVSSKIQENQENNFLKISS